MKEIGLIDSHLHLQDYEPGTDIASVIRESVAAGVTHLVCNGTEETDWTEVLEIAKSCDRVIPCLGLHPWFAASATSGWADALEAGIANSNAGVGEIGLDRLRTPFDRNAQEQAFVRQLDIACRYNRPAMIHCVRAWGWMMDILRGGTNMPESFLMHSYAGSADLVRPLCDMGAYFSFSGKVLLDGYHRARTAIKVVPIDRLLIETDAPNMIPPNDYCRHKVIFSDGYEGNHPGNLPNIMTGIADLLGIRPNDLKDILWANSIRFFGSLMCKNTRM